jgi:hypothetical protein
MKLDSLRLAAFFGWIMISLAGCASRTETRSTGGTKIDGREVKFALDGNGGVTSTAGMTTVTFSQGKVIVEKTRVLVNDKEVASVAEDVKVVTVDYTAKTLTVTADGTKIHEEKLGK